MVWWVRNARFCFVQCTQNIRRPPPRRKGSRSCWHSRSLTRHTSRARCAGGVLLPSLNLSRSSRSGRIDDFDRNTPDGGFVSSNADAHVSTNVRAASLYLFIRGGFALMNNLIIDLIFVLISANLAISDEECESLLDSRNVSLFVDNVSWVRVIRMNSELFFPVNDTFVSIIYFEQVLTVDPSTMYST